MRLSVIKVGTSKTIQSVGGRMPAASTSVAVIGGGLGGLFVTHLLNKQAPTARVTIFEATAGVGGKINTQFFNDGTPYEAGIAELYEYVSHKDHMRQLIEKELDLPTRNMEGGCVILDNNIINSFEDLERFYGPTTRAAVVNFHKLMTRLLSTNEYSISKWRDENKHPWAGRKFHDCLEDEIPDDAIARRFITVAVHSDLATEPHVCNGLNGIKNVLMDNDKYLRLYHIQGGLERLPQKLAATVTAKILINSPVTRVTKNTDDTYKINYREDGKADERNFDAVIIAIPNHWYHHIEWGGARLQQAVHDHCEHYDLPAHYLRVTALFHNPFWKKFKIPGEYWMSDAFGGSCVYDESSRWQATTGHVLSWLIAGNAALTLQSQDQQPEDLIKQCVETLPVQMRTSARSLYREGRVNRYFGSLNAQPGGWPMKNLDEEHILEPRSHPGLFLVGDYLYDSTLNGTFASAEIAAKLTATHVKGR